MVRHHTHSKSYSVTPRARQVHFMVLHLSLSAGFNKVRHAFLWWYFYLTWNLDLYVLLAVFDCQLISFMIFDVQAQDMSRLHEGRAAVLCERIEAVHSHLTENMKCNLKLVAL